jgi:hypothetical protein
MTTQIGRTSTSAGRTPAQLYALIFGATLVIVGILGFIANATFNAGTSVDGSDFIIFEVNGWHNIVHILSGLFLLAVARRPGAAKTGVIAFGLMYLVVTIWGFIDGDTVLWLIPVDLADNLLHVALSALALVSGFISPADPEPAYAGG